jgi:hypothetical protein
MFPVYNVDVCMSSLPKVYVMIKNVFGGGAGTILAVDIDIFNNWHPTMLTTVYVCFL